MSVQSFDELIDTMIHFLNSIPAVTVLAHDGSLNGYWWIKLDIDLSHHLAWHVVQELGFVLNYISLDEPLPTVFKPVSPPPYLNGGPNDFLSWVIESTQENVDPNLIASHLEGRLPRPVHDENEWATE